MAYGSITITDLEEGSQIWTTTVAPTVDTSGEEPVYIFNISDLTGSPNASVKVGDVIMYESSTYNITSVGQTTVNASFLQDLKGADGQDGKTLYGTCSTVANVATKVVVCADATEVVSGLTIVVKFDNENSVANNIYLTVANETAQVYFNGSVVGSTNQFLWGAGASIQFVYNGTYWIPLGYPCSYYGICSTTSDVANKVSLINQTVICKGSVFNIRMDDKNEANNPTLNISNTGAKGIYADGALITANSYFNWQSASILLLTFDGEKYNLSNTSAISMASNAQTSANEAQTAADNAHTVASSKAHVFRSTPTVPYYAGDAWVNITQVSEDNESSKLYICINPREATGDASTDTWHDDWMIDWVLASTDDTMVYSLMGQFNVLSTELSTTQTALESAIIQSQRNAEQLAEYGDYFNIENQILKLSASNSDLSLELTNSAVNFLFKGAVMAFMNANGFNFNTGVVQTQLRIGNFLLTSVESGRFDVVYSPIQTQSS